MVQLIGLAKNSAVAVEKNENNMSRMNSRNRKKYYRLLVDRDGEHCRICHKRGDDKSLVIDHVDNNNDNNDPINLQLLCKSDNSRKNPRGPGRKKVLSPLSASEFDAPKITSAEFLKNSIAEPQFRHWAFDQIRSKKEVPFDDLIYGGAETAHCSPETSKKYLRKASSEQGIFEIVEDQEKKKYVRLRPIRISRLILSEQQKVDSNPITLLKMQGNVDRIGSLK